MRILNPEKIRQIFFLAILILLGWVLFRELQSFIPAFLGALTFYVLMRKWMFRLLLRKWKPALAATILMVASFIIIMVPILLLGSMMSSKITYAISHSSELLKSLEQFVHTQEARFGVKILSNDNIKKAGDAIAKELPSILGATFNILITIAVMYFILYFMLVQGQKMENGFMNMLPVSRQHIQKIKKEINDMVVSNAIGIPLIAILQGIVGLIGYLILGVKEPLLWFALTCFTAMLPMIGAAFAYVPLALIFFANGEVWKGVIMLIFGFGVIGTVDNIFRFWLQRKIGDVHPLITVFGVIIGIQLFGFIGLVFGPLLISLFLLLVKIYHLEFTPGAEDVDLNVHPQENK